MDQIGHKRPLLGMVRQDLVGKYQKKSDNNEKKLMFVLDL